MPAQQTPGTFRCPDCRRRITVEIKGGGWFWGKHTRDGSKDGPACNLSEKRMA